METQRISDLYERRRQEREALLKDFFDPAGKRRFLIVQKAQGRIWGTCNSVREIVANNLLQIEGELAVDWSDELPYLEPWIGTGVYANAFGCEYVFREDAAPHVHYLHHKIDEVRGIPYPDWRKSPIMRMVLDCIGELKEATHGGIPVSLTDTQSAFDTATLILDAAEFFTSCYTDEDVVMDFMDKINRLIVEFSREQARQIGDSLWARPGHIMPSAPWGGGISISDDNLAVSSPTINERISLPFNRKLADEFGSVAIHSCGAWTHTMELLGRLGGVSMIDCAVHRSCDPNPNEPRKVRDALKGSGIILKARMNSNIEDCERIIGDLFDPSIKLIVQIGFDAKDGERNYKRLSERLESLYNS